MDSNEFTLENKFKSIKSRLISDTFVLEQYIDRIQVRLKCQTDISASDTCNGNQQRMDQQRMSMDNVVNKKQGRIVI
jgi:hypothetical protein